MQKKSVRTALIYALPGLVSVGFAVFAAFSKRADRAGILFGGAAALVFQLLIFRLLPVFFDFLRRTKKNLRVRTWVREAEEGCTLGFKSFFPRSLFNLLQLLQYMRRI